MAREASRKKLMSLATTTAYFIDAEKHERILNEDDEESSEYKKLHKQIIQDLSAAIVHIKTVNDMKERLVVIAQEWLLEHILYQDMLIEKYRVRMCAHPEETGVKVDTPKEVKEEKRHAENIIYRYTCGCPDKIHTVSQTIHEQLQRGEVAYRCKTCGKRIVYTESTHGN